LSTSTAKFEADLETSAGGAGTAPSPHDLLDAALASCTVLTLQVYSKRKQYPLQAAHVEVTHTETPSGYQLKRVLRLTGELSQEQITDLLRVANVCPIHKALHKQFEVVTELENTGGEDAHS
ncbi:MAG: OsmC family protein, partial [Burkholderiales bacterium]|nr:OsmC family protein [Burkholderiales bacterium]